MKKAILLFLFCFLPFLHANATVEELKNQVCKELPKLQGWCSQEKALNFIDLVLEIKPQVCVEIGVYGGRSIFPVASALKFLKNGVVIGIDPWDKLECLKYLETVEDQCHLDSWARIDLESIYRSYLNTIKEYDLQDYCITYKMSSAKAAPKIEAIDILYLDGNHSETISTQDVRLYLPKVRSGGYIWMNDLHWDSLQSANDLLQQSCDPIHLIENGKCILFRKR